MPANPDTTFLRFAFGGVVTAHHPERTLGRWHLRTVWLTNDEIRANQGTPPQPAVLALLRKIIWSGNTIRSIYWCTMNKIHFTANRCIACSFILVYPI